MSLDPKVLSAKNDAEVARARLMHSVTHAIGEAKRRLAPDLLAQKAWDATKQKGNDLAHDAVVTARRKPFMVGGIAALAGLILARGPAGDLAGKVADKIRSSRKEDDEMLADDDTLCREAPDSPVAVARAAKQCGPAKAPAKKKTENI